MCLLRPLPHHPELSLRASYFFSKWQTERARWSTFCNILDILERQASAAFLSVA